MLLSNYYKNKNGNYKKKNREGFYKKKESKNPIKILHNHPFTKIKLLYFITLKKKSQTEHYLVIS